MTNLMKAAVLENYGENLEIKPIEKPVPKEGEVLVKVKASGVNPLDLKIRTGNAAHAQTKLPAVLGIDMAGIIEEVGPGVEDFKVGDEIYGMTGGIGGVQGSLAEYAAVDARLISSKPGNLTFRETAALPLTIITAWEGLVDRAKVGPGKKVLIHGGAGGVGSVGIQISKALGAEVYATGTALQKSIIEDLGATHIDYTTTSVEEYMERFTDGEGFDIILDTIGGANLDLSFNAAKIYTGHVVSILGWGSHSLAPLSFRGATYSGVFTLLPLLTGKGREHHGEILKEAAKIIEMTDFKVVLNPKEYTLENVQEAYNDIEKGIVRGKTVIII